VGLIAQTSNYATGLLTVQTSQQTINVIFPMLVLYRLVISCCIHSLRIAAANS